MNVTLSDDSKSNEFDESVEKKENFMAFTAFVKSAGGFSENDPPILIEICEEESQDDSDEEIDLQVAYNQLCKECAKLKRLNILTFKKKMNEVENEK